MMSRMKIIAGITLVLGITSIALLAVPTQADYNGIDDGDSLQAQDMDRQARTQGCECDCDMIQNQDHIRERLQAQDCKCSPIGNRVEEQNFIRQRTNEYATNRTCNSLTSLEQYRYQHRSQNREKQEG